MSLYKIVRYRIILLFNYITMIKDKKNNKIDINIVFYT